MLLKLLKVFATELIDVEFSFMSLKCLWRVYNYYYVKLVWKNKKVKSNDPFIDIYLNDFK